MPATWYIYHVKNCCHVKPTPKDKFVVIVCRDLKAMGFLVNSEIRPYVQKRPNLLACQVIIEASSHKCLDYDSYVDCSNLYPFEDTELSARNPITKQAKEDIKKAVTNSKTIELRYQKLILGT